MLGWMTVFWRKKYPMWLFHGLSGSFDYTARAWSYGALLTDQFPSFSREQSMVSLDFDDPPSGYLSRLRVLFWKGILLFPPHGVLPVLAMAVFGAPCSLSAFSNRELSKVMFQSRSACSAGTTASWP